jgi:hypothetical protein
MTRPEPLWKSILGGLLMLAACGVWTVALAILNELINQ